eukprot:TRINITY_DN19493_c0_g1_i1.p1 TRINITY_DN19493_c0_g1~~TRINITY_DN19493_c0_g1_i1.p1  ORF type:complete len:421 (-),score=74.61 TRINITY_DN19493_c0_g1_i1:139-1401(-)
MRAMPTMRCIAILSMASCLTHAATGEPHSQRMDLVSFNNIFEKAFADQMQGAQLPRGTIGGQMQISQGPGPGGGVMEVMSAPIGGQVQVSQGTGPGGNIMEVVSFDRPLMPEPQMLRGLFPGPLLMQIDGPGGARVPAMPFHDPDPLVLDMLSSVDALMQNAIPEIHRVESASSAPASCNRDLAKHCSKARSQIHCLGQHSEDVSESCQKDVGHSVPFTCSKAIDKFCDIMQVGILDCLRSHTAELQGDCLDCVLATRKAITGLNAAAKSKPSSTADSKVSAVSGAAIAKFDASLLAAKAAPAARSHSSNAMMQSQQERILDAQLGTLSTNAVLNFDAPKLQSLVSDMAATVNKLADARDHRERLHNCKIVFCCMVIMVVVFFTLKTAKAKTMISACLRQKNAAGRPLLEMPKPVDEAML